MKTIVKCLSYRKLRVGKQGRNLKMNACVSMPV